MFVRVADPVERPFLGEDRVKVFSDIASGDGRTPGSGHPTRRRQNRLGMGQADRVA
jgi:hypothetical protein